MLPPYSGLIFVTCILHKKMARAPYGFWHNFRIKSYIQSIIFKCYKPLFTHMYNLFPFYFSLQLIIPSKFLSLFLVLFKPTFYCHINYYLINNVKYMYAKGTVAKLWITIVPSLEDSLSGSWRTRAEHSSEARKACRLFETLVGNFRADRRLRNACRLMEAISPSDLRD